MGVNPLEVGQLQALAGQTDEPELRRLILDLVGEYARRHHAPKSFVPGESPVPVSGKVYGAEDMRLLVDSALDFWLTTEEEDYQILPTGDGEALVAYLLALRKAETPLPEAKE